MTDNRFKPYNQNQLFLLPPDLSELIPEWLFLLQHQGERAAAYAEHLDIREIGLILARRLLLGPLEHVGGHELG